jgi:hypothetical protein
LIHCLLLLSTTFTSSSVLRPLVMKCLCHCWVRTLKMIAHGILCMSHLLFFLWSSCPPLCLCPPAPTGLDTFPQTQGHPPCITCSASLSGVCLFHRKLKIIINKVIMSREEQRLDLNSSWWFPVSNIPEFHFSYIWLPGINQW